MENRGTVTSSPSDANPLDDVVSSQYERWIYPAPILDLPGWLQSSWQWFDPSHSHRVMWPDRDYQPGMDILVAGCGTNQAAVLAYTNPQAHVVAIDVSEASLSHHRYLVDKYGMRNLELHRLPIEDVDSLDRDFDLIVSTGVLHHLASPEAGMRALAARMRPDAVLAVMLYATYGRLGVQMMQTAFRDMGLGQDEDSVRLVKDAIVHLNATHPLQAYLGVAPDVQDDAGIVDTFLHGRERDYTIDECRELVASSGLAFQDVFLKSPYYAPMSTSSTFLRAVAALPRHQQWSIMERFNGGNGCHFFTACRPDRPRDSYEIDFASGDPFGYVPSLRHGCRLEGTVMLRHDWQVNLDSLQSALISRVDGRRSIGEIINDVQSREVAPHADRAMAGLDTFKSLYQLDFLAMGIVRAS